MNIRNITVGLSGQDIINFLKLQDIVDVNEVEISEFITLRGSYKIMNINLKFQLDLSFSRVEGNVVYVDITHLRFLKLNFANSIVKKAANYIINSFAKIEGIKLEGQEFALEVQKLVSQFYKEDTFVALSKLEVKDIKIIEGEIDVALKGIGIDTEELTSKDPKENEDEENKDEVVEEEVVDPEVIEVEVVEEIATDGELETSLTVDEIEKYSENFSEESFFDKIKKYGKSAGASVVYGALVLYYTYKDSNVPVKAKAISLGALGYFILPIDIIPDFVLGGLGYTDDIFAIIKALQMIQPYVNEEIKQNAKNRLTQWFKNIEDKDIELIDKYL